MKGLLVVIGFAAVLLGSIPEVWAKGAPGGGSGVPCATQPQGGAVKGTAAVEFLDNEGNSLDVILRLDFNGKLFWLRAHRTNVNVTTTGALACALLRKPDSISPQGLGDKILEKLGFDPLLFSIALSDNSVKDADLAHCVNEAEEPDCATTRRSNSLGDFTIYIQKL